MWHLVYKPDTEYKRRFKRILGIKLTPDVEDIRYYGDYIGIDFSVYLSFTCDYSTIKRIISAKGLKLARDNDMGGLSFPSSWCVEEKISTIRPYKKSKGYDFHQYLWYDKDNRKAYYREFST